MERSDPDDRSASASANEMESHANVSISGFYMRHSCKVFWIGILCLLTLTVPARDMANFSAQSTHEYTVTESSVAREFDSADLAMKAVDSLSSESGTNETYRPRAFPSTQWGQFTAMYGWDEKTAEDPDSSIFTPRSVQQICQFEQAMFDHPEYPDFCVLDYDNKFKRGSDACVPPLTVPSRLFYETTVLNCSDYMSRLFVAINVSHPNDPTKWRLASLASDASNCEEIARDSNMPLVHYVNGRIIATPSVIGMPAYITASNNPSGTPSAPAMFTALGAPATWQLPEQIPIFNYSAASTSTDCPLLSQDHVDTVNEYLIAMLRKDDLGGTLGNLRGRDLFGFFMAEDADDLGYTKRSRTFYSLGAPLDPYVDEFDDSAAQREEYLEFARKVETAYFKRFKMVNRGLPAPRSAYRTKVSFSCMDSPLTWWLGLGPQFQCNVPSLSFVPMSGSHPFSQCLIYYFFIPLLTSQAVEEGVAFEFYALLFQLGEFTRTMNGDLPMTFLAVLFVWGYITFHTRSLFLSNMAMIQILLSLPVSYTVYRYVWGIPFFSQLHILAIFLVLGVGADDIFVITDAWKETLFTVDPAASAGTTIDRKDPAVATEYRRRRLSFAYGRTVIAVFNTSFTTAMAFVATGISPIMSIATFGWFAATTIVMNYVITVTWYPAVIIVKEQYVDAWFGKHVTKSRTAENPYGLPEEFPVPASKESCVVRCFKRCYVPMMTKKVGPLPARSVPLAIAVLLFGYMAQAAYFTMKLSPPNEEEQFFPADHMFTGLQSRLTDNYMGGAESSYAPMSFVFGIEAESIDRSGYNRYYPDVNRGKTVYDDSFDIYPKANQEALAEFCKTIKSKKCIDVDDGSAELKGCASSDNRLIRGGTMQVGLNAYIAFSVQFHDQQNPILRIYTHRYNIPLHIHVTILMLKNILVLYNRISCVAPRQF